MFEPFVPIVHKCWASRST